MKRPRGRPEKSIEERYVTKAIRFPPALWAELSELVPAGERSRYIHETLARSLKRRRRAVTKGGPGAAESGHTAGERPEAAEDEKTQARVRPIWEELIELANEVPDEDLVGLPTDLAEQHDHYIYGTPKR